VIKERVRATRHTLPFKVIPLVMLIYLISSSTLWINAFPPKGGVSFTLSPRNIMTGVAFDYNKHFQLPFGSYVQVHKDNNPTSSMAARTLGAICLGPTGNIQGSYKFLNLRTGKRITRRRWNSLPMPQQVIDRVNELGKADGLPELLTFYDRKGRLIGDSETSGVSDSTDTTIPPDDGLGDLNPPTASQGYGLDDGLDEGQDIDPPLADTETVHEPEVPDENPIETLDDIDSLQNPDEHPEPDPTQPPEPIDPEVLGHIEDQPPEPIDPEVLDPGATPLRRSQRARTNPERLIPSFGGKSYESIAQLFMTESLR
jgi:hypothetical protein